MLRRGVLGLFHGQHAAADLFHDKRVVFRQLHELAIAEEIDAAVADMGDAELAVGEAGGHQGGAHPGGGLVLVSVAQDGFVGLVDGIGQQACPYRGVGQRGVGGHGFLVAKIRQHGIDSDLAGDFPGGVATHAVADDKNAQPLVVADAVFVGRTHLTHIAASRNLKSQWHARYSVRRDEEYRECRKCHPGVESWDFSPPGPGGRA